MSDDLFISEWWSFPLTTAVYINEEVVELSIFDLFSAHFQRVLICMIYEWWSFCSFNNSSLPTVEVVDLSLNDLSSPRFPRFFNCENAKIGHDLCSHPFQSVLIYMIYQWCSLWSVYHSGLPTLEEVDLKLNDLFSHCFPRVLIYMLCEWWSFPLSTEVYIFKK